MDRLMAMRVFAQVAASGSFSASADKLDMSRAMVTRYVGELEHWLGARLLQRTTRSVTLTEAGEQALRRSTQMLALMEDLEQETAQRDGQLRGQLRITASTSFAFSHLAQALVQFQAQHTMLRIDLNVGDSTLNLVDARIDLAIRISSEPDPGLIARPLARCDSVLVASPQYVAVHGAPQHPLELARHPCLCHANLGKNFWRFTRGAEQVEVGVSSHFSANDAGALLQAALAGGGIAMQPAYLANSWLARGELLAVLPQWQVPAMTLYALYPSRRHLSPAIRALVDFLVQHFATLPW